MTIAAVAGSDFSRAFLNQVELGRARPSTRSMRIIAERLQRPIEYFLGDAELQAPLLELALVESESLLKSGDPAGAERLLSGLLARPVPREPQVRCRLIMGEALVKQGRPAAAMEVLEKGFPIAGTPEDYIQLCCGLGRACEALERAADAEEWFARGLARYQEEALQDRVMKGLVLADLARTRQLLGRTREAIRTYETALAAIGDAYEPAALGRMYLGLTTSLHESGQPVRALACARRALGFLATLDDVRAIGGVRTSLGDLLLLQGQAAEAEQVLADGAREMHRAGDLDLQATLLAGVAEAALEQGAIDRAQTANNAALQLLPQVAGHRARVQVQRVAGRIAHASGLEAEARAHFQSALTAAELAPREISRVAYDYGLVLQAQGDPTSAAQRFREAYELNRSNPM